MLLFLCLLLLFTAVQSSEIILHPFKNETHRHFHKREMKKNKCIRDKVFYKYCILKKTGTYNIMFNKTHYFIFDNSNEQQTLTLNAKPVYKYKKKTLFRLK